MKNVNKIVLLAAIGCLMASLCKGQENDSLTYQAYLTGALGLWEEEVSQRSKALEADPESKELLYELALAQYGLLNGTMATQDEEMFNTYLEATKTNLEKLIELDKKWAEPRALLSSVYGLQMGYSPWKGMFLGGKSSSLMEKALKLNDGSALVNKLYAGSKLFTPEMFGGDAEVAADTYMRAIELYEMEEADIKQNWLYLDALAFAGQAYEKLDRPKDAITVYQKALAVEPEFVWVKYQLLPRVESKTN